MMDDLQKIAAEVERQQRQLWAFLAQKVELSQAARLMVHVALSSASSYRTTLQAIASQLELERIASRVTLSKEVEGGAGT